MINNRTKVLEEDTPDKTDIFFLTESVCIFWFSLELIGRLISSPSKLEFVKDVMNLIDLMAIVPYFSKICECLFNLFINLMSFFLIFKLVTLGTMLIKERNVESEDLKVSKLQEKQTQQTMWLAVLRVVR